MSETRERISEKTGAQARLSKTGLDVKLARGGIRDIEFLVQCLQRLHGVTGNVGAAWRHVARFGQTARSRLVIQHRIFPFGGRLRIFAQARTPAAVGRRPADAHATGEFGRFGASSARLPPPYGAAAATLLKELNQRLENVQVIYERIVHAQRPLHYSPVTSDRASGCREAPPGERGEVEISGELLEALAEPAPHFAQRLRERGLHRSERALHAFLSSLGREPRQLQLLNSHSALADWMLQIFELSPYLGEQLARFPELLEEIRRAVDHPTRRWAFEGLAAR